MDSDLTRSVRPPFARDSLMSRTRSAWSNLSSEIGLLLRTSRGILCRNWMRTLLIAGLIVGIGISMFMPWEPELMVWVAGFRKSPDGLWLNLTAWTLSEYGDFIGLNGLMLLGLGVAAAIRRSHFLRLTMLACLLGTTFSGVTANVLRATLGRARPNSKMEPGFYGPSLSARFHSCPSGHTATAFGGTIPVAVAIPQVGVPLMIVAASVAWSRFHNRAHHPSDILFSMTLAAIYGIPLGMAVRRLGRRRNSQHSAEGGVN